MAFRASCGWIRGSRTTEVKNRAFYYEGLKRICHEILWEGRQSVCVSFQKMGILLLFKKISFAIEQKGKDYQHIKYQPGEKHL